VRLAAVHALVVTLLGALASGAAGEDPQRAPRSLDECDRAVRERPREQEAWSCYLQLAHAWSRGRAPVIRHLEAAVARSPADPMPRLWLGILAHDAGMAARTETLLRPAADDFHALRDDAGEVLARAELSVMLCYAGRAADGDLQLSALDALVGRSGDPVLRADALRAAAVCARKAHDHALAISLSQQARALFAAPPTSFYARLLLQHVLDGLGSSYSDTGRHRDAFEVFRQLAALQPIDPFFESILRHRLASQSIDLADEGELDWEEVDLRIRQSLEMETRLPSPHWGPYATRILQAARLGSSPRAVERLEEAVAFWRPRAAWGVLTADRLLAKAAIDLEPQERAAALARVEESLALAKGMGNQWDEGMALLMRSYVYWHGGSRPEAVADGMAALDVMDALRDRQSGPMVRAWTTSESSFAYQLVAGWLLDPGRGAPSPAEVELAFGAIERHRARVLLETLLSPGGQQASPPRIPTLWQLQSALGPDQALISFQVWKRQHTIDAPYEDGSSWALAVTRESVRATRIPDSDALRDRVLFLRGLLQRRDGSEKEGAIALYRDLLRDALGGMSPAIEQLILVPDGPLHLLPFAVLRAAADAPPLGASYALSVAPSAVLWLRGRTRPAWPAEPAALVLANPAPSGAVVPLLAASLTRSGSVAARAGPLESLPFADAEARAIAAGLGRETRILSGPAASEALLKSADLNRVRILHFAAHALIDEESPERSAVVLAPGAAGEDGLLQLREVAGLALSGKLVVLATCESANGLLLRGEGPLSLARGFFGAGAQAVVASLWRLRDDEAASVFSAFYEQLGTGASVARALAAAQRRKMREGAPAESWAGLVVFGDGAMEPWPVRSRSQRGLWIALAAAAVLAALGAGFWLRSRRP
jgi:tetratricopeptide (TPR) repeat protein